MGQKICTNPDCRKVYDVNDKDADESCCSFECWEILHCKTPPVVQIEKFEVA